MRPRGVATAGRMLRESEGQMVVEMAVVTPVMIVVAIIVLNLMWFLEASARFDRVAFDAVIATAVSPADGEGLAEHAATEAITEAMGGLRGVTVEVSASTVWDDLASGDGFTMAPQLTRYVCTMVYEPWPSALTVAGVEAGIPLELRHERAIVVDRYRPGVLF